MTDQNHQMFLGNLLEGLHHHFRILVIKGPRGFICEEDPGPSHKCAQNGDSLLLASGKKAYFFAFEKI